jgi:hypothetical protein
MYWIKLNALHLQTPPTTVLTSEGKTVYTDTVVNRDA